MTTDQTTWTATAAVRRLARMGYRIRYAGDGIVVLTDGEHDVEPEREVGSWAGAWQACADLETLRWPRDRTTAINRARQLLAFAIDELETFKRVFPMTAPPATVNEPVIDAARRFARTLSP